MIAGRMRREGTFRLRADFTPEGDQPQAIAAHAEGVRAGAPHQVLLGVTGSGKTFTVSHVIANLNRPTLVIAPNKTLAAQLYHEFRTLFPDNAVRYFVSYYDYYQTEAYVPSTDTYIEKDASINDEIDKMRHAATKALLERNDVVVVASVSCIYGLGSPTSYFDMLVFLDRETQVERDVMLRKLVDMQYQRSDYDFHRGTFRVRGDVVEIFPAYEEARAIRVELFGDRVETLSEIDPLRGTVLRRLERVAIYPASHYVAGEEVMKRAVETIRAELAERLAVLRREHKLLEAQRLEQRTRYDLELLAEMGFCPDIETIERVDIIRDLRRGEFDVLVGINLLREGLDLPEVSLVAILDADKEGYLRSERSLIQTIGRAARNVNGTVLMYADAVTDSMRKALDETNRRRAVQQEYNRVHGITPQTIRKAIAEPLAAVCEADYLTVPVAEEEDELAALAPAELAQRVSALRREMREAAKQLEFERAAEIRDRIKTLEARVLGVAPADAG